MAKDAKKSRCSNWSHEETMVLSELRKEAFLNKREGRLVWERIAQTISSRFPNKKRSPDQCRRRWETLTKIYKHIEQYCMETGQEHWQLDEDELSSMKLDTAYRQDWYNIVKQVCSQRKRKEKSDCDLMAVKRGKRSGNCSSPSPVLPGPAPGRGSLYVIAPASNCEPVVTPFVNGQISTRPSLEAEKLSAEEEIRRLHTILREKDALILEFEQLRQHGQVALKDQVQHNSPAESRAHVKEPLQDAVLDAVLDCREVTVERSLKAAEQYDIGCELMVPLSGSLSPEFFSDSQLLGAKNLAGCNDPCYSSTCFSTTLLFPTTECLEPSYSWINGIRSIHLCGTPVASGSEPRSYQEGNQLCGGWNFQATFLSRLRSLMQYRLICFHILLFQTSEFQDETSCLNSCRLELYRDKFYQQLLRLNRSEME